MSLIQTLGGLGLFLLGMVLLTDGLKALAGDRIRSVLLRFTHSPLTGATTGTLCTALLQSSSATTVAAVGFVGAGLLSFPQALGVIFGANLGTTLTGWIVALLGFKFKLQSLAFLLVLLGALLKLFAKPRLAACGYAVAGFGVIFVGIDQLQQGMAGLGDFISPERLPGDSWLGRMQLVLMGAVLTIVTQSSSAGVALALTLLAAGAIRFEQAMALVIGMDIGTTATAALATVGGSLAARRTGLSHVIYNLLTGLVALCLITPYLLLLELLVPGVRDNNAELALVAFHSGFNFLGVVAVLPFTRPFAQGIERLLPETKAQERVLEPSLLKQPILALNTARAEVERLFAEFLAITWNLLDLEKHQPPDQSRLIELQEELDRTQAYLDHIHLQQDSGADWRQLVALMHVLDHMQRLHERIEEEGDRAVIARSTHELTDECALLTRAARNAHQALVDKEWQKVQSEFEQGMQIIMADVERYRAEVVDQVACGELSVPAGSARLAAIRWLERISTHLYRVARHLTLANQAATYEKSEAANASK